MSARTFTRLAKLTFVALILGLGMSSNAFGQVMIFGPGGIQYQDGFGNSRTVSLRRLLDPRANMAVPGSESYYSYQDPNTGNWVQVRTYWGMDNRPHRDEQTTNPWGNTTTTTLRSRDITRSPSYGGSGGGYVPRSNYGRPNASPGFGIPRR